MPVLAVNDAVEAFAAIATEAGTVSAGLSLARVTVAPPAGATLDSVTVQEVLALGPSEEAVHCSEETVAGATRDTFVETDELFKVAVLVAF